MNLLDQFISILSAQKPTPSRATVKNYRADVAKFLRWCELKFGMFNPATITPQVIELYKNFLTQKNAEQYAEPRGNDSVVSRSVQQSSALRTNDNKEVSNTGKSSTNHTLSLRSVERHLSSLRKFFNFLKLKGEIDASPFEMQNNELRIKNNDPYKLHDFKNHLYVFNASDLTIKNYIMDAKQFFNWAEKVLRLDQLHEVSQRNIFKHIDTELLEEYRDRLQHEAGLSPVSINRKLSSLRRYLSFAKAEGLIENHELRITNNELRKDTQEKNHNSLFFIPHSSNANHNNIHQNSSEGDRVTAIPQYSKIPPIRLFQRMGHVLSLGFEAALIAPLTAVALKLHLIKWKLSGGSVFVKPELRITNNELRKDAQEKNHNSLFFIPHSPIKGFAKSFYAPHAISLEGLPWHKKVWFHARYTRPKWYKRYHENPITHYFHFAILVIIMTALGVGMYQAFVNDPATKGLVKAAPVAPPRILSFQGRLTDASDNPITTAATPLRFAIYNDLSASGAALLWQEIVSVSPDTDGIFSVLLGNNTTIPQSLFGDNASLYLGITVQSTSELTPRQQIATVPYATNAELLQGMPPITDVTAGTTNVILALNSSGNLAIGGSATPVFQATGGSFTLQGTTTIISTTTGSAGNVNIIPDGLGKIDLQKPIQNSTNNNNVVGAAGSVEIDDSLSVLGTTSASLFTLEQQGTGPLISASVSGVAKFTVANTGSITSAAYTNAGGILYTATTGLIGQTAVGTAAQCLIGGTIPSFASCPSGTTDPFWQQTLGALTPNNSTVDLLIGGQSTASAKFAFVNVNSGNPTATISGNLALAVPTTAGANTLDLLNNSTLNIRTSQGGDAGATTALFIATRGNGGNIGIGITAPLALFHVGTGGTPGVASTGDAYIQNDLEVDGVLNVGSTGTFGSTLTASNGFTMTTGALSLTATSGSINTTGLSSATVSVTAGTLALATVTSGNITLTTGAGTGLVNVLTGNLKVGAGTPTLTLDGDDAYVTGSLEVDGALNTASTVTFTTFTTNGGLLYTNGSGVVAQTAAGSSSLCLKGGTTPGYGSCNDYWSQANGALYPNNSTVDLLIGGQSTASAKFAFINVNSGNPTATISGNLALAVPTTAGANTLKLLNNSTLNFQTSVGGDAGATSRLFIGSDGTGGNIGIGTTAPGTKLDVVGGTIRTDADVYGGDLYLGYDDVSATITTNDTDENLTIDPNGTGTITLTTATLTLSGTTTITAASLDTLTSSATLGVSATTLNLGAGAAATIGTISDDNLSLSPNGTGDIRLVNDADTDIVMPGFTSNGGLLYTNGTGVLAQVTAGTSNQCLLGGTTPTFGSCDTGGYWTQANGTLYPSITTQDLLLGGVSTASAKFAIINMNSGNPTATISGNFALAVPTTAGANTLDLFNNSTLNIRTSQGGDAGATTALFINNRGNSGNIGIGTTAPGAKLEVGDGTDGLRVSSVGDITFVDANGAATITGPDGGELNINAANSKNLALATTTAGNITLTPAAATGLVNVLTGNLKVGAGTPTLTLDGEDAYVTGSLEVDGITNFAGAATFGSTTSLGGIVYTWPGSQSASYVLSTNGSGTLSWVDAGAVGGVNYWNSANGTLYPKIVTQDLLLGGVSTASAKFAFINVNSGNPTASIAGNLALAVPTTAGANTLKLLNNSTLNFQTSVGGDAGANSRLYIARDGLGGNIGIGTTAPGSLLHVSGNITGSLLGLGVNNGGGINARDLLSLTTSTAATTGTIQRGIEMGNLTIGSDATSQVDGIYVGITTPNSVFTTTNLYGINIGGISKGASHTITSYAGLAIADNPTSTNNTLLLLNTSTIPSGSFEIYSAGTNASYFAGNVGIGTTAPGNKLSITEAAAVNPTIPALGSNGGTLGVFADAGKYGLIGGALATGNYFLQVQRVDGTATAYNMLLQPSGGNVGIGTTAPGAKLEIGDGTDALRVSSVGDITFVDANDGASITGPAGGALSIAAANSTNLALSTTTAGNITLTPAAATGLVNVLTGNLKVGAGTPTLTLDGEDAYVTGTLEVDGVLNVAGVVTLANYTNNGGIFYANGSGVVSQTAAGTITDCLIGGTTPSWSNCSSLSSNWNVANGTIYPKLASTLDLLIGGVSTASAKFAFINVNSGNPTASISGNLALAVPTTAGANTLKLLNNSTLNIQTSVGGDAGATSRLFISSDGAGGNIGIGTTAPALTLHVASSTGIRVSGAGANERYRSDWSGSSTGMNLNAFDNTGGVYLPMTFDFDTSVNFRDAASTSRLYIDTAGNVGIGTTAPGQILHIRKDQNVETMLKVENQNSAAGAIADLLLSIDGGAANGALIMYGPNDATYPDQLILSSGSGVSNGLRLNTDVGHVLLMPAGNVGIGTTAPGAQFTLANGGAANVFNVDNANVFAAKNSSGTYESYLWPRWSDNITYMNFGASGFNIRNNSSTSVMFMQNGGNVGIGTTAPDGNLHVAGDGTPNLLIAADVDNFNPQLYAYTTAFASDHFATAINDNQGTKITAGYSASRMRLFTTSADAATINFETMPHGSTSYLNRMAITSDGNVGVGITNPSYPLDVYKSSNGIAMHINIGGTDAIGLGNEGAFGHSTITFKGTNVFMGKNTSYGLALGSGVAYTDVPTTATYMNIIGNVGLGTTTPSTFKLESAGSIGPTVDATYDLGSASKRWNTVYASSIIGALGYFTGDFATATSSALQSQVQSMNLVANADFETNVDGTGEDNWTPSVLSTGTAARATDDRSSGAYSMKLTAADTVDDYGRFISSKFIQVRPSTSYTLGIDVKQSGSCLNGFYSRVWWYDQWGNIITNSDAYSNSNVVTTSWATYTGSITSSATAYQAKLEFYNYRSGNGGTCTRWYDNVFFRQTNFDGNINFATTTGNVGIGTTAPLALLDVGITAVGAQRGMLTNTDSGTGSYAEWAVRNGSTASMDDSMRMLAMGTGYTTSGGFVQDSGVLDADGNLSGGLSIMTRAAAPIRFYTNGHTNERMRIASDGNVGIGTTAPGARLEVTSAANTTGIIASTGAGGATGDQIVLKGTYVENGATYMQLGWNSNGFHNPNYSYVSSSLPLILQPTSGNVGIGQTAPATALHVGTGVSSAVGGANNIFVGTSNAAAYISVKSSTNPEVFLGSDASTYGIVGTLSNHKLGFRANNTLYMTLSTAGNLGIGASATTPNASLDINNGAGSASQILNIFAAGFRNDSARMFNMYHLVNSGATGLEQYFFLNGTLGSTAAFDTPKCTAPYGGCVAMRGNDNGLDIYTIAGAQTNGALTSRLTVLSSTGNVGIGTTSPSKLLEVLKDQNAETAMIVRNTTAGTGSYALLGAVTSGGATDLFSLMAFSSSYTTGSQYAADTGLLEADSGLTGGIGISARADNANADIKFWTESAATPKMIIDNDGNVGIGDTAPSTKLEVNGTITGNAFADYINSAYFWDGAATGTSMAVAGNVGIGTTAPGNKLSVVTGVGEDDTLPALGANGGKFSLLNNTGTYGLLQGVLGTGIAFIQAQRVDATATAYSLLLNPNGGNVGIGTTAPGYKLVAAGAAYTGSAFSRGGYINAIGTRQAAYSFDGSTINTTQWLNSATGVSQNGQLNFAGGAVNWTEGVISKAVYHRGNNLVMEADVTPTVNGYMMIGWHNQSTAYSYTEGSHYLYFVSGGTFQYYENGASGVASGSWTTGTTYRVRISLNTAGGATYSLSSDGGYTWAVLATSGTTVTTTPVKVGVAYYSGTFAVDNWDVYSTEGPGVLYGNLGLINEVAGNVGIGTSAPVRKLDVRGEILNGNAADASPYTQARLSVYGPGIDATNWAYFAYGADAQFRIVYGKTSANRTMLWGTTSATDNTGTFVQTMSLTEAGNLTNIGTLTVQGTGNSSIAGNVGIGTTAPGALLDVAGVLKLSATGTLPTDEANTIRGVSGGQMEFRGGATGYTFINTDNTATLFSVSNTGYGAFNTSVSTNYRFTFAESTATVWALLVQNSANSSSGQGLLVNAGNGSGATFAYFYTSANNPAGKIVWDGANTLYQTFSDRRLKENITPTEYGLDDLLKIETVDYSLITDPNHKKTTGFIAQDLYNVFPVPVSKGDGLAGSTNEYWQVDYGRITPLLVKSIQELNQKVEENKQEAVLATATISTQLTGLENMRLDTTGNLAIAPTPDPLRYEIKKNGTVLTQIGAFSEAWIANLKVGSIDVRNLQINGVSVDNYIATIVNNILNTRYEILNTPQVIAPIASIDRVYTNALSPLPSGNGAITIDGNLAVNGSATISGKLTANSLQTTDASISGTLRARNIIADNIVGLQATIATLAANTVTNITNIYQTDSGQSQNDESIYADEEASPSALLASLGLLDQQNNFSSTSANLGTLIADFGTFNQGLLALGPSSFTDVAVSGQFSVGSLYLNDNSINTLGADLELQPLAQGGIRIMGGKISINTNGDIQFGEDATFAKNVRVNGKLIGKVISPIPDEDLVIELGTDGLGDSRFLVKNATGSAVFQVNQAGDLTASGSANIAKLNFNLIKPAIATGAGDLIAFDAAGVATISATRSEITIHNSLVTEKSLIYLTPVGELTTQPVYLMRQVAGESFTVGGLAGSVFNWLIIN